MFFDENLQESEVIAREALDRMAEHAVPSVPNNFHVWYAYQTGRFAELNHFVDGVLAEKGKLTHSDCTEVYRRFFVDDSAEDELCDASLKVEAQIEQMVTRLKEAGSNTAEYGAYLKTFTEELADSEKQDDAQVMIASALAQTRQMAERNEELEARLNKSTSEIEELKRHLEDVRKEAMTDPLTGIANRKAFDYALEKDSREARDTALPLCLLMIDIDHFKKFNDTFGHQLGDQVLKLVARTITQSIKGRDTAARYGGEEFSVILPHTTLDDAHTVAEQIRIAVNSKKITRKASGEDLGTVALSIGVSLYVPDEPVDAFIRRADDALYTAKRSGRNQVVTEQQVALAQAG